METNMKENLQIISQMEKACIPGPTEKSTKESGNKTFGMEKGLSISRTVHDMWGI